MSKETVITDAVRKSKVRAWIFKLLARMEDEEVEEANFHESTWEHSVQIEVKFK